MSTKGLDLDAMARNGRFAFVDGLSSLFTGKAADAAGGDRGSRILRTSEIDHVRSEIETALADLRTGTKILVIDQLDALLAASGEDVTSTGLAAMLLSLREVSPDSHSR
jgi:elongator complex protein 6